MVWDTEVPVLLCFPTAPKKLLSYCAFSLSVAVTSPSCKVAVRRSTAAGRVLWSVSARIADRFPD
jgi:hypothetical protein